MTTQPDLFDELAAGNRFTDDGCPNHGDAPSQQHEYRVATPKAAPCCRHARQILALKKVYERLRRLFRQERRRARTDALTGLLCRRAVETAAITEVLRRGRYPAPLTIVLIDVDEFKAINRAFLVPGGDRALVGLAGALTASARQTDRIGRLGGDEFLVVAPQTDTAGAAALAERLRAEVHAADVSYAGQAIHITVSIGLAVADAGVAAEYGQLLHAAAVALGEAKERGRNAYVIRSLPPSSESG